MKHINSVSVYKSHGVYMKHINSVSVYKSHMCFSVFQCFAVCCICYQVQHNSEFPHCNTLQHSATLCNTPQQMCCQIQHNGEFPHCNTLQNICSPLQNTATHCNTCVPHCNTLQHTATDALPSSPAVCLRPALVVCVCMCVCVCVCVCMSLQNSILQTLNPLKNPILPILCPTGQRP